MSVRGEAAREMGEGDEGGHLVPFLAVAGAFAGATLRSTNAIIANRTHQFRFDTVNITVSFAPSALSWQI